LESVSFVKKEFAPSLSKIISRALPEAPVGLRIELEAHQANLSWGTMPNSSTYRLYRRPRGGEWTVVHEGPETHYRDHLNGLLPPLEIPGLEAEARRSKPTLAPIWDYAVSACNDHGEGPLSLTEDTDPTRWNHWRPKVPLHFQRRSGYHYPPYIHESSAPAERYP
jgi:hypothetical protein